MFKTVAVVSSLFIACSACGSVTWDGARFIRNGLAEWYDDIGGNGVSNIYFEQDGAFLYTGNAATPDVHWLAEEFTRPGVYDYTFKASNNLGQTGTTVYQLEVNFDGGVYGEVQASTTDDYTGGLVLISDGLRVELTLFAFDIIPLAGGGVDEVSNWNSVPDGAEDIVGQVQFTVTAYVPPPCLGDVDDDGFVNVIDLLAVLNAWDGGAGLPADVNDDGIVDITDLLFVLAEWGPCPQ